MKSLLNIAAGKGSGDPGGGGPEGEGQSGNDIVRSHGILSLAFGFALGIALLVLYLIIYLANLSPVILNMLPGSSLLVHLVICFVVGFVCGTLISIIYNLIIIRRFNLFGIDRGVD
jgi:4-amino-4-deoxy-L-arabinose transferase-like glycosyltransferase